MKRIITSALVLALAVGAAQAQTTTGTDKDGQQKEFHHRGDHGKAFSKLNLTDDQKTQLKSIREDFHKQMEALKKQDQMSVADMKTRKQELHKQFRDKMESVLTPTQKDQLAKMRADWKANHKDGTAWEGRGQHNGRSQQFVKMQKELGLTQDQQSQMAKIRSDFKGQFESIRNDKSLSEDQKKDKFHDLMKQQKEQMKTVLTKEQIEKLQSLRQERKSRDTK